MSFELDGVPPLDAEALSALRRRARGLKPADVQQLRRVAEALAAGDRLQSGQWLLALSAAAPGHPEVLRWQGLRQLLVGNWGEAADSLAAAAAAQAPEFGLQLRLARACGNAGRTAAAQAALEAAAALAGSAPEHRALAQEADRQGEVALALRAADAALRLAPDDGVSLLQRARSRMALGDGDGAAADCRALIARGEHLGAAWFLLLDLKTVRLSEPERSALQAAHAAARGFQAQSLLGFALGKAHEDAGEHDAALHAFQQANALVREVEPWDAARFGAQVDAVLAAFEQAVAWPDAPQGREVIFLVGLPRSGSTLFEQVLAAHPWVEGASELPYLQMVLDGESRRRGSPFPAWVPRASADDWLRLGREYLALSERWRRTRPVSTDKLPANWLYVGAVLRMLPSATVLDCQREALETCWSCFKQRFAPGLASYSYDLASLAGYWYEHERTMRHWARCHPARVHRLSYESLVRDPPTQTRALDQACGLPPDARPPATGPGAGPPPVRAIRTPSALQVRQPLLRVSRPAASYGQRLDPLRERLREAALRVDSGLVFPASIRGG